MRALVLHAHPLAESYSSAVLAALTDGLEARDHRVEVARIAEGDDPGPEALVAADLVAFVHPTWWGGLPGVLLDWVQRRLGPWIDGGEARASCPLRNVRHLLAVTTHGSPGWINRLQGEPGRQLYSRTVAGLCAPDVQFRWFPLYGIDTADDADRIEYLRRVGTDLCEAVSA